MEHAVRFEFVASNNEVEYEALLLGIYICCNSGAQILSAYLGQVNGLFEAKDNNMRMYLQKVKTMVKQLKQFYISHIPKSKNAQANSLAK